MTKPLRGKGDTGPMHAPCARCDHSWEHHRWRPVGLLGRCWDCSCPAYLPSVKEIEGEAVRVITPEQLHDGYVRQRGIGDLGDRYDYTVIRRLADGNYLVREPS